MMKFELNEDQKATLKVWQDFINDLYGEYGVFDYIFTPCGIGTIVKVKSHLTGTQLNLTDVEKW